MRKRLQKFSQTKNCFCRFLYYLCPILDSTKKEKMKLKKFQKYNLTFAVLPFLSLMIFHFCYKYHFFLQEQNQIFIYSKQYFFEYFSQNGFLTAFLGDFITQFFYYLFVGPIVTSMLIFFTALELRKILSNIFSINLSFFITLTIEILLIFTVFNNNFRLDFLLTVFFAVFSYRIYSKIFKKGDFISASICLIIVYYSAGFAQIIFAFLFAAKSLKEMKLKEFIIIPALVFIIPLFGQRFFQTTYKNNLLYPGVYSPKLPDLYTEFSYSVSTEYYFKHFEKLEQIALKQDTMTAQSGIYYNMIQAQKGILPEKIENQAIPELGTLIHIDENSPSEAIFLMNDFYYLIGDMAMAERAAILAEVFSPKNRNVKMLKRLCEINLVSADTAIAMKYVRILEKTLLYKDWAKKHNPYSLDEKVKKEILEKRKFSNTSKSIRISDNCREILTELLESNPENTVALDYLLCTDLILGQTQTFKADYYKFCVKNNRERLNKLYIKALQK